MELSWENKSVCALLEFIAEASEDAHDAVVYDSGYEFDRSAQAAVQFIAFTIIQKTGLVIPQISEPEDGSVYPRESQPNEESLLQLFLDRIEKERDAELHCLEDSCNTYIPISNGYYKALYDVIMEPMIFASTRQWEHEMQKMKITKVIAIVAIALFLIGIVSAITIQ